MDINHGGIQGSMAHKFSDHKQIVAVFIKVGAEGMAEGMAGDAVLPAETLFMARICRMR